MTSAFTPTFPSTARSPHFDDVLALARACPSYSNEPLEMPAADIRRADEGDGTLMAKVIKRTWKAGGRKLIANNAALTDDGPHWYLNAECPHPSSHREPGETEQEEDA